MSFVTNSFAVELYFGGNAGLTMPTGDFAKDDIEQIQGAAEGGTAMSAELGVHGLNGDFYVGFRQDYFPAASSFYGLGLDGSWKASRLVYGARLHLPNVTPSRVDPMFGVALTYGKTKVEAETDYVHDTYSAEQTTPDGAGLMLEGGVTFYLAKGFTGLASLQYHSFAAELEDYDFTYDDEGFRVNADDLDVTYVVLNLGVRFRLFGN